MYKRKTIGILTLSLIFILGACSMNFSQKSILSQHGGYPELNLRLPTEEEREEFNNPSYSEWGPSGFFYPNSFDKQAAQALGLADKNGYYDNYFLVQDLYRHVAEALLYDDLNLEKYDEMVKQAKILPRDEADKIYYQRMNTMPTEYIYLRNNIYVERLSKEEIQIFLNAIEGDKATITDEIVTIVKGTIPVILRCIEGFEDDYKVNYGANVPGPYSKIVANNALLLEVSFRFENDENGKPLFDREEIINELLRREIIPAMQEEQPEYEEMPVVIFLGEWVDT